MLSRTTAAFALSFLALAGCRGTATAGPSAPASDGSNPVSRSVVVPLRSQALEIIKSSFAGSQTIEHVYAAEIVADTGLREFTPQLRTLLKVDSVPVRFAAAMALGDLKYLPAKTAIADALNDPDENVRMAAIYALSRFGSGGSHIKRVYEGLSSKDQTVRANAALIVGKLHDTAALTALYWALSDKDSSEDTRVQVAFSIALIGDEKIYPKLWTLLISSYANYRILGIEAMGALNDVQARNAVYTMLRDDVLDVRLAAAEQLGVMHDPSGEKVIFDYLKNPVSAADPVELERRNVRAARGIGSLGTADLVTFLPQLLRDKSAIVRLAAAKSVLQLSK